MTSTFIMQESHCAHMVLLLYATKAFLTFCFVFLFSFCFIFSDFYKEQMKQYL